MNDQLFGARRSVPLHATVLPSDAAENTLENSTLQQDTAVEPGVQDHTPLSTDDYTISVQQAREHLRSKGLTKSKDTIQRWCREGDLDCQKLGVLGRYFTTETSLLSLEQKLLPDMMADGAGARAAARRGTPLQPEVDHQHAQRHAGVETSDHVDVPLHADADTAASDSMQQPMPSNAAASKGMPRSAEVAELRAEVSGLAKQLEQAQEMNQFLREEIVSSRGQRGDVVKIAEQMLGTLETIAIGGRLERTKQPSSAPQAMHDQYTQSDPSAV